MKKSKADSSGGGKKCSEKAAFDISEDGTVLSMVSRLENNKNNLCSKNIFKIYKIDENSDCVKIGEQQGKNIKIFIKNENNITNYNCVRDIPEPIIMNHKNCRNNRNNFKTSHFSCEKRNSYPCKTPTSQPYCGFLRKKFDSEVKNLPSFLSHREYAPILSKRKSTKKNDEFTSVESLMEESFIVSDETEIEPSNYFPKQCSSRVHSNKLNERVMNNSLFSSKRLLTRPKYVPKYNKIVQTETKLPKKYSLERKDGVKNVNQTVFPRINEKNQESSNFSLFKSMNSNELGNYIDNLIHSFRKKAHICEHESENTHFNNAIFYPENRENSFLSKKEEKSEPQSIADISKMCKNDNTSFDKSSFQTQSLTNLVESRAFEEEKEETDLNESTTFINYTHSFEIDEESQDDQITYPSTTD